MSLRAISTKRRENTNWTEFLEGSLSSTTREVEKKVSIFTYSELIFAYSFVSIWMIFFIEFVFWYGVSSFSTDTFFYWLTTINIFWLPALAIYFYYFSLRGEDFSKEYTKIPTGRLALITTKVPSEPLNIVQNTLRAMLKQKFPRKYDVWLCDEDPTEETIRWCEENNVQISTRKGNPDYYRTIHPRKRRCKEGNLSFFYDKYGYDKYDFVIQFDADHAPEKDFSIEVMKQFNDPKVGYVATPSIIDLNNNESWTVRARNYWEATTHGPLQSGAQSGYAPVCFGSHYSLRTKALKEAGGIGPEIAEDYTSTLMLNAIGWKGAFARNAIAHGMGAVGVVDCMIQEYQWSLVGMRAALLVAPKAFLKMPFKIKLQMVVWTFWYPVVTLISLISILIPPFSMWTNYSPIYIEGEQFWIKYLLLNATFIAYVYWLKNLKHLRPHWAWQLSWETMVFQILQLPWIFIGWVRGLYQVITGFDPIKSEKKKLHHTDKANTAAKGIPFKYFLPHFIVILTNLPGVLYLDQNAPYFWFAVFTCLVYSLSVFVGVFLSIVEVTNFDTQFRARQKYIKQFFPTISVSFLLLTMTLFGILKSII